MAEPNLDSILDALNRSEQATEQSAAVKIEKAGDLLPYVSVLDPEGIALQKMQPWPLALELLNDFWPKYKRTVGLKARQLGVSWDFALYCLHHCGWQAYRTAGSVNYTLDEASKLIWRMRVLWSTLPAWLKPDVEWSTHAARFANGSRVLALATTEMAGAGETFSLMGIDEAGLIKNLGDNWPSLLPAVEKGQLHVFSTPRDATGKFADLVAQCRAHGRVLTRTKQTLDAEVPPGAFVMRDMDYDERPDRDQSTPEGQAWKAARIAELGERGFAREFQKEFQRPGECYFEDSIIEILRAGCMRPSEVIWQGRLRIYQRPVPGRGYKIGADVAEGLADGDASSAHVIDQLSGVVVAKYKGRIGLTEYAQDLVALGKLYNNAWLAIEANNHGHAVCAWAYQHCRYRRVYRESREEEGQLQGPARYRLGILNTSSTKPMMLAELEDGFRKGAIKVHDAETVEELASFLRLPGGGYGAAPGKHDDDVVSLMLAQNARGRSAPKIL